MLRIKFMHFRLGAALGLLSALLSGCSTQANTRYWGQVDVPKDNTMRYITGSEPESLDPQFVTGQPEARIMIGLYDRLVEYHPKTMEPIPSMASNWEVSKDGSNYTFYLRKDGKFSNGDPIKAEDFSWSIRRALSPELASRYAFLGYDIKYGEAYNAGKSFLKKDGEFLLSKDFPKDADAEDKTDPAKIETPEKDGYKDTASKPDTGLSGDVPAGTQQAATDFQKFINAPERLTVPADDKGKADAVKDNPRLGDAYDGAEMVPVKAEDIGIEVVDEFTLRMTLKQSAPYFVGLLTHQFFGALHRPTIDKFGKDWIKPANIVTSGAFKLGEWKPYDEMTIVKDPNHWDAENVSLDAITFYPMEEQTTMMNIYKSGRVDALYNHTVPAAWNESIRQFKDEYQLFPEAAIEYYTFSVKKPPVDKLEVRQALALAIDRAALEEYRKTSKRLVNFTPEGIFPKYEEARKAIYPKLLAKAGSSQEEWNKRMFNPAGACDLMAKAGYEVAKLEEGRCNVADFPADDVALSYNTAESNKQVAEFVQAQWKQNLGITIQLKNMEWKTFLPYRSAIEYTGMARAGWVGDFMDPYTFLSQFYSKTNDSSTGWWDPKYDKMLDDANKTSDPMKRFEKLAEAEFYLLQDQPMIPLLTSGTSWMKKPYIKGLYPNPGTMHPWKFVYIERDRSKWDENVEKIMENKDLRVEQQVSRLMKTQEDFERSKSVKTSDPAEAEE